MKINFQRGFYRPNYENPSLQSDFLKFTLVESSRFDNDMATTAKLYKKVFAYFFLKKVSRKKTDDVLGVAFLRPHSVIGTFLELSLSKD